MDWELVRDRLCSVGTRIIWDLYWWYPLFAIFRSVSFFSVYLFISSILSGIDLQANWLVLFCCAFISQRKLIEIIAKQGDCQQQLEIAILAVLAVYATGYMLPREIMSLIVSWELRQAQSIESANPRGVNWNVATNLLLFVFLSFFHKKDLKKISRSVLMDQRPLDLFVFLIRRIAKNSRPPPQC